MVDTRNPYAAPQADAVPGEQYYSDALLTDAPQGTRFVNFLLDTIFRQVFAVALAAIAAALGSHGLVMVMIVISIFGYYVVFEALTGRTPAKYITRTRVVDVMGGKPTFMQILGRSAARFIPFEPFSFFGSGYGWHDKMSRTRVVRI
ncbi:MAG: RDD family protein [Myxococcales bacterium]